MLRSRLLALQVIHGGVIGHERGGDSLVERPA
jgi:hypothetical protein